MKLTIKIWNINKWLRFTGFRIHVEYDPDLDFEEREHKLGLMWWGRPSKGVINE